MKAHFLALLPPATVRCALARCHSLQSSVRGALTGQPTPPADLHLTLVYVGRRIAIPQIARAAGAVARRSRGFTLTLDHTGWWQRGGIAWVAPSAPPERLVTLQAALVSALEREGHHPDPRAYRPHVTLARKASGPPTCPVIPDWPVDAFYLLDSDVEAPAGAPRYGVVRRFPLQ